MSLQDNCPFSMSTMHKALQEICFSKGISACIPPPGFPPRTSSPITYTRPRELFMQITSSKLGVVISKQDGEELLMTVSLLTSDTDYFMGVIRNQFGSRHVQALLGKSDDVDAFFYAAILRRFFDIMTDKYASYVATRAMVVFDQVKKHALYEHALHYALDIACGPHGVIALQRVIADVDDPFFKNRLLDVVTHNALFLSNDPSGNYVVQHVLSMHDVRCKHSVAVSLRGHFVDLSFKKFGSYIVEKLLEAEVSMGVVVVELLKCDGDRLMRLAKSEFGNFVVLKALRVTREMNRVALFWDLVQKLMPFRHLLLESHHGISIARILKRFSITTRC